MEVVFEKNLISRGYSFQKYQKGYYEVYNLHRIQPCVRVQYIPSKPVDTIYHGSQNGNQIDGIGVFQLSIKDSLFDPEIIVFSLQNLMTENYEYMIIPAEKLMRSLMKNMIRYRNGENLELRLWLIDDHLYDTTNLGLEGEYFYLSKGAGGRMIDSTIWNYSRFLNNWVLGSRD